MEEIPDDAAPVALAHLGNDGTAKPAHGRQLGLNHLLPVGVRCQHDATRVCPAGIVDHDIDAAETLHGARDDAIRLPRIGHIRCNRQHLPRTSRTHGEQV